MERMAVGRYDLESPLILFDFISINELLFIFLSILGKINDID
jgi:hypothetical protein